MKKQLTILAIIATTLITSLTGCALLRQAQNQQAMITSAASFGTSYDLSKRPNDLPYFVAAEQQLYNIANSTNKVNQATIENALIAAGQTNINVNIALLSAISLGDQLIAANSSNSDTNLVIFKEVCGWTADGVDQAVKNKLATVKYSK